MAITSLSVTTGVNYQGGTTTSPAKSTTSAFVINQTTRYGVTGSGVGVVTKEWDDYRTIVAAGNDDIDLAGALVNSDGVTTVFAKIKVFYIRFESGTGTLTIDGGSNPVPLFAGVLNPGETLLYDAGTTGAGHTVTAGTGDIMRVTSSAANAVYSIFAAGE